MPETWNAGLEIAAVTDVGMRRANNQDAFISLPADTLDRFLRRGHLFVVADGMGAHAAGELASRMAADKIGQYYLQQSPMDSETALRMAVQEANSDIHRRGQQNPEFYNMGTTASSMVILPEGVIVAHVGDSRVYRLRDGKFEQLTFDHSLVWEMQASGQVHPNSALSQSIPKNVITRSLGPSAEVVVDMEGPFPVKEGDRFLLCSDGLSGQVADEEIGPILASLDPDLAARFLIDLANLRGGPDNSTLIIVHVAESQSATNGFKSTSHSTTNPILPLIFGTPILCFLAAFLLWFTGNIGPMVVAVILGLVAAAVAAHQLRRLSQDTNAKLSPDRQSLRSAPYRSYAAKPNDELVARLSEVLKALQKAAEERKWTVDWARINAMIDDAGKAKDRGDRRTAIGCQAKAIVETMAQLRSQNKRPEPARVESDSVLD